ncbi:hypothetical protein GN958_ATG00266 [Phytophthora infestans]|uniref:Uncharacterized protein n=1 Tax=Phytophthora infestans TaxID=4787 RepID=A0A8S9VGH3_PHYIN|nr:hypothetical protein GN958_ATG00266 [Phytophthora infestans]
MLVAISQLSTPGLYKTSTELKGETAGFVRDVRLNQTATGSSLDGGGSRTRGNLDGAGKTENGACKIKNDRGLMWHSKVAYRVENESVQGRQV